MTKENITSFLCSAGLVIVAAGALLPILMGPHAMAAKITLSAGAIILLAGRLFSPYKGKIFRVRRLFAIEKWSAIFFCTAAFFMWYSDDPREWLVFLLAGAFIQLYTSISIPYFINKAAKEEAAEKQSKHKS